jgi:hypothetical protein
MSQKTHLNGVRSEALKRMERSERNYKLAFFCAVAVEGLFFLGFLLLANLRDPLHLLILISTVASYLIIILGLFALGAHVSRNTQTVLRAIELLEHKSAEDES